MVEPEAPPYPASATPSLTQARRRQRAPSTHGFTPPWHGVVFGSTASGTPRGLTLREQRPVPSPCPRPPPSCAGEDDGLCLVHEAVRTLQRFEQSLSTAALGRDLGPAGEVDQLAAIAQQLGGLEHVLGDARRVRRTRLGGGLLALRRTGFRRTAGRPGPLRVGSALRWGDDGVCRAVLREVLLVLR